jgi:hypothetical protein
MFTHAEHAQKNVYCKYAEPAQKMCVSHAQLAQKYSNYQNILRMLRCAIKWATHNKYPNSKDFKKSFRKLACGFKINHKKF